MSDKIVSRPLSDEGRETWDRIFGEVAEHNPNKFSASVFSVHQCQGCGEMFTTIGVGDQECPYCGAIAKL